MQWGHIWGHNSIYRKNNILKTINYCFVSMPLPAPFSLNEK
jgi:hypothetical protein